MGLNVLEKRLELAFNKVKKLNVEVNNEAKLLAKIILREIANRFDIKDIPGHEMEHTFRVLELGLIICDKVGCDQKIIVTCALLHDIARMIGPHVSKHSLRSAEVAENLIKEVGGLKESLRGINLESIKKCIIEHSYSSGLKASSLESKVLQDADRLDALGAIGVARVFAYGGYLGRPLYSMLDPRGRGGSLGHFYEKIFKLADLMNTEIAKNIAKSRLKKVKDFVEMLEEEIELNDL